jgi:hypothetical protein
LRNEPQLVAHALPTSHVADPDLAFIVGIWDRLADECKRRLVEIVQGSLTTQATNDEFNELNERTDERLR